MVIFHCYVSSPEGKTFSGSILQITPKLLPTCGALPFCCVAACDGTCGSSAGGTCGAGSQGGGTAGAGPGSCPTGPTGAKGPPPGLGIGPVAPGGTGWGTGLGGTGWGNGYSKSVARNSVGCRFSKVWSGWRPMS